MNPLDLRLIWFKITDKYAFYYIILFSLYKLYGCSSIHAIVALPKTNSFIRRLSTKLKCVFPQKDMHKLSD